MNGYSVENRRGDDLSGSNPPPGWYSDYADASKWRWWDGERWTGRTEPRQRQVQPPPPTQPPIPRPQDYKPLPVKKKMTFKEFLWPSPPPPPASRPLEFKITNSAVVVADETYNLATIVRVFSFDRIKKKKGRVNPVREHFLILDTSRRLFAVLQSENGYLIRDMEMKIAGALKEPPENPIVVNIPEGVVIFGDQINQSGIGNLGKYGQEN